MSSSYKTMRLNQYIANAGICSRRKAEKLILAGEISVNGVPVTTLAYQVAPTDQVCHRKKPLSLMKKHHLLLYKPFNVVTTLQDPAGRKTVFDLIQHRIKTHIYPVGRLDRNTTGLLLLTNDGALAKALSHPAHGVPKVYHITLKQPLRPNDLAKLQKGVMLEDGLVRPDVIAWEKRTPKELQITLHSGKNRILRRLFSHLGHQILSLERTAYAGLTKGSLKPGAFRSLAPEEITMLQQWL